MATPSGARRRSVNSAHPATVTETSRTGNDRAYRGAAQGWALFADLRYA